MIEVVLRVRIAQPCVVLWWRFRVLPSLPPPPYFFLLKTRKSPEWIGNVAWTQRYLTGPLSRDSFNSIQIKVIAPSLQFGLFMPSVYFYFSLFSFSFNLLSWYHWRGKYQLWWSSYYFINPLFKYLHLYIYLSIHLSIYLNHKWTNGKKTSNMDRLTLIIKKTGIF